jgi:hypothetical protein
VALKNPPSTPPDILKAYGIIASGMNENKRPLITSDAPAVFEPVFDAVKLMAVSTSDTAKIAAIRGYTSNVFRNKSHHCLKYFSVPGRTARTIATGEIKVKITTSACLIASVIRVVRTSMNTGSNRNHSVERMAPSAPFSVAIAKKSPTAKSGVVALAAPWSTVECNVPAASNGALIR